MNTAEELTASGKTRKLCFVTIGATAGFQSLIKAILDIKFICALHDTGYTELRVQYGKEESSIFDDFVRTNGEGGDSGGDSVRGTLVEGILVTGFDFKLEGLAADMRDAKGGIDELVEGVVISHAGTGSILEAFRANSPLIVVPNVTLLDNHQQELADELARQKYVIVGKTENLPAAIFEIEEQRSRRKPWLPVNSQDGLTPSKRFFAVLDEQMGFVD